MKSATLQLAAALCLTIATGCGSDGGEAIVTPSGQIISASPVAPPSQDAEGSTTSQAPRRTAPPDAPEATQKTRLPDHAALAALLEFTGAFLSHATNPSTDVYDSPDGTYTMILKGTDESGDGQYSLTGQYLATSSPDGTTSTLKLVKKHIDLKHFTFRSRCLGEIILDGELNAIGWQVNHRDTFLTDFEYHYSTAANTNGIVSVVIAGTPHALTLNDVKVMAENKTTSDLSTLKFGSGTFFDGNVQDLNSQLQGVITNSCFF